MKTLKPIEHYLIPKSQGKAPIIFLRNFIQDGIDLTVEEGFFLGSLEYNYLHGVIPIIEKGIPKYIKVHPIVEACYEVIASKRTIDKKPKSFLLHLASDLGITVEEFKLNYSKAIAMAKSILEKLEVDIGPIQAGINRGVGLNL